MIKPMIVPMLQPMIPGGMVGVGAPVGGGGAPAYDLAGLLAYAQIAGYGSPSGGWMPNVNQPDRAAILARISGGLR